MNIFKNFEKKGVPKINQNEQSCQFKQVMSFADFGLSDSKSIRKLNARLDFLNYIIAVLREDLKYALIAQVMYTDDVIDLDKKFIPICKDIEGNDVDVQKNLSLQDRNMWLADDCVIGNPWVQQRIWSLAVDLLKAPFIQDSNQQGVYFPELNLCFVYSGNHSIAVGSIYKTGVIRVKECSIEPAFEHLKSDGISWINVHTNEIIEPVRDFRIAALFEIAKKVYYLKNDIESRINRTNFESKKRFENKFELSLIESVSLARKQLVPSIYLATKLEEANITLSEVQTILNDENVANVTLDDIKLILNLNEAWEYLLFSISDLVDINYVCKINDFVVRNQNNRWDIPEELKVNVLRTRFDILKLCFDVVEMKIEEILDPSLSVTEQALEFFIYCINHEPFWKWNKSTGLLIANKILISDGAGILQISEENMTLFNQELKNLKKTKDSAQLKTFLHENCIKGLE